MVKIAVAGAGSLSKYMVDEFIEKSIEVVVLIRSDKDWLKDLPVEPRKTDFSDIESILANIQDCDGIVSVLNDTTKSFEDAHLNMIEAMLKSEKCKKFIPSEYAGNLTDYPDQPLFYNENHLKFRQRLKELGKSQLEWTLLNIGWLNNYFLKADRRYLYDIGRLFPIMWDEETLTVPGTGNEISSFTTARDLARCVSALFFTSKPWEDITYACGETTTWNELIKRHDGFGLKVSYRSLTQILADYVDSIINKDQDKRFLTEFELFTISGAWGLPRDLVAKHKEAYFSHIDFLTIDDTIELANKTTGSIV